jgi:HEAT repeat protein
MEAAERSIYQTLGATLKHSDPVMCERAAIALGQIGRTRKALVPPDTALLREAVKHDHVAVRIYAYRALHRVGQQGFANDGTWRDEAVELLAKALEHEDWTVRYKAADVLREIHDAKAVPPLVRALQDECQPVRLAAAQALGAIGDPASVAPLIAALGDRDSGVRYTAAEALGAVGQPAIAALQEASRATAARVRLGAALALGRIQRDLATSALKQPADRQLVAELLGADDEAGRPFAAELAGLLADKTLVEPLVAALADPNSNVRYRAAEALGRIGDAAAVEPLGEILRDPCQAVRVRAVESLGAIQTPSVVPALIEAMKDENHAVRTCARIALSRVGAPAVPALIACLGYRGPPWPESTGREIWSQFGKSEEGGLEVQRHANEFPLPLGSIGAPAVAPLIKALDQTDGVALQGVLLALARVWAKDDVDGALTPDTGSHLRILKSGDYVVPARVSNAFVPGGVWLPTEPSKPLPLILGIEVVQVTAHDRLVKPDPELAPETTGALVDALTKVLKEPTLRSKATQPESEGHPQARDTLRTALLVLGLARSPRAVDTLMEFLPDPVLGHEATVALGRIKDPQSVGRLIAALQDRSARNQAAVALGLIGDPRAIGPLEEALKDADEGFRERVGKALAKIRGEP